MTGPLLTSKTHDLLCRGRSAGESSISCSLDLDRSTTVVELLPEHWCWQGQAFPYLKKCKDRTVYHWDGSSFEPIARFNGSLIKLVPTPWGPPTFEIDGIKMLPTAQISPWDDAENKVALIQPRGKRVLDTCGGLGYFAAWCQQGQAAGVQSFEKNPDVIWLRSLNPWSPRTDAVLSLTQGDVCEHLEALDSASFDAALHDPPRFGIAGELYSQRFYDQLARVLKPGGKLFHYTGSPNRLTSGRDVPKEVAQRLRNAGFVAELKLDGVLAAKGPRMIRA
ncbi:MAG: SAM-dependent methyltransferase [Xanthomonadales bacterium]|nr:SAM-dependent methyltransferase [Xanthomonadales bacterium]MCP5476337.1 SAM-dependent methyltransferase [Rhodanobacteraceae bacterium]